MSRGAAKESSAAPRLRSITRTKFSLEAEYESISAAAASGARRGSGVRLTSVQIKLYDSAMPTKKITFTTAREKLSALIDEVRLSGKPVTITKRGRPAAVLVNCEIFEQKLSGTKQKPW